MTKRIVAYVPDAIYKYIEDKQKEGYSMSGYVEALIKKDMERVGEKLILMKGKPKKDI